MPSPEAAQRKDQFNWVQLAIRYGTVALIAGALTFLAMEFLSDDEDDRPPIIVRNATVHVDLSSHAGGDGGKLEKKANREWFHAPSSPKPPKPPNKLEALLTGVVASSSCPNAPIVLVQRVQKLVVHYGATAASSASLTFEIKQGGGQKRLEILSTEDAKSESDNSLVFAEEGVNMRSVEVTFKKKGSKVDTVIQCTFEVGGLVPSMASVMQRQ